MTIICALHDPNSGQVWLGGNDGDTIGETRLPGAVDKWLDFGAWALALSGEGVHADILRGERENFPSAETSPLQIAKFLRATYAEFEIGSEADDWASPAYGVSGILVHRDGRIWDVDSHLALSAIPAGSLWARGSGMEFALGADFALQATAIAPADRVETAVQAAIHLDTECPGNALVWRFPARAVGAPDSSQTRARGPRAVAVAD